MTTDEVDKKRPERKTLYAIVSFYFFMYATLGTIFPFSGYYFRERGFSGTELGMFLAAMPIGRFLFTTKWTDVFSKTGNKTMFMSLCVVLSILSFIPVHYVSGRFYIFFCIFMFTFFRLGLIPVADNIAITYGERHNVQYGRMRLFGSLGFIFSVMITGPMIDAKGLDWFLYMFITFGLLSSVPVFFMNIESLAAKSTGKIAKFKMDKNFLLMILAVAFYLASFSFHSNFFNIRVKEVGLSQTHSSYMWSLGVTFEVIFMYIGAMFFKFLSARALIAMSMLMGTLRFLLISFFSAPWVLYMASTLHGFAFGTFHIGMLMYISRTLSPEARLRAQSMYAAYGFGLGFFAGSYGSGMLYDLGGTFYVFIVAAILSTIAAGIIMTLKKDEPAA